MISFHGHVEEKKTRTEANDESLLNFSGIENSMTSTQKASDKDIDRYCLELHENLKEDSNPKHEEHSEVTDNLVDMEEGAGNSTLKPDQDHDYLLNLSKIADKSLEPSLLRIKILSLEDEIKRKDVIIQEKDEETDVLRFEIEDVLKKVGELEKDAKNMYHISDTIREVQNFS